MAVDRKKRYILKHFDSYQDCEDWLNQVEPFYKPVALADTISYVTVLVERDTTFVGPETR